MGFLTKKFRSRPYSTEYSPTDTLASKSRNSAYSTLEDLQKIQKKDGVCVIALATRFAIILYRRQTELKILQQIKKKLIRILRFLSRTTSLVLSGIMIGFLSYSLANYARTADRLVADKHIWGETTPLLWPTYLILSISCVTLVMNSLTLVAYIWGFGAANKTDDITTWIVWILLGSEVVVWAVSSGIYKVTDTGKDLWGRSCGIHKADKAGKLSPEVKSFINFGKVCHCQVCITTRRRIVG